MNNRVYGIFFLLMVPGSIHCMGLIEKMQNSIKYTVQEKMPSVYIHWWRNGRIDNNDIRDAIASDAVNFLETALEDKKNNKLHNASFNVDKLSCRPDNTLLHLAVDKRKTHIAELLLKYGADVNARDQAGETPLHKALSLGDDKHSLIAKDFFIAGLLLQYNPDLTVADAGGRTIFKTVEDGYRFTACERKGLINYISKKQNISRVSGYVLGGGQGHEYIYRDNVIYPNLKAMVACDPDLIPIIFGQVLEKRSDHTQQWFNYYKKELSNTGNMLTQAQRAILKNQNSSMSREVLGYDASKFAPQLITFPRLSSKKALQEFLAVDPQHNLRSILAVAIKTQDENLKTLMKDFVLNNPNHNVNGDDLQQAINEHDIARVKWLLELNPTLCDVPVDDKGNSALMLAVKNDDKQMGRFLLEQGASLSSGAASAQVSVLNYATPEMAQMINDYMDELSSIYKKIYELYPKYTQEKESYTHIKNHELKNESSCDEIIVDSVTKYKNIAHIIFQAMDEVDGDIDLVRATMKKRAELRSSCLLDSVCAQMQASLEKYTAYNEQAGMACCICLQDYDNTKRVVCCKNNHSICLNCFNNPTVDICPLCRNDLSFDKLMMCQNCGIAKKSAKFVYCSGCDSSCVKCKKCSVMPCCEKFATDKKPEILALVKPFQTKAEYLQHVDDAMQKELEKMQISFFHKAQQLEDEAMAQKNEIEEELDTLTQQCGSELSEVESLSEWANYSISERARFDMMKKKLVHLGAKLELLVKLHDEIESKERRDIEQLREECEEKDASIRQKFEERKKRIRNM